MEYVKNCRVLAHTLLGSRDCIPVELQGRSRFPKWHSEIMKVVRSVVTLRLLCKHMQDIEEVYNIYIYIYIYIYIISKRASHRPPRPACNFYNSENVQHLLTPNMYLICNVWIYGLTVSYQSTQRSLSMSSLCLYFVSFIFQTLMFFEFLSRDVVNI